MPRNVALLRGINVGGRRIAMADLRVCFEQLGFSDVRTVLQTGNVAFDDDAAPAELKGRIEEALSGTFGYAAKVQVLLLERLMRIIEASPYTGDADFHAYVVFLEDGLAEQLVAETVALADGEEIAVGDGVVYWRCPKGSTLDSAFAKQLTRAPYREANTNRNINTLRKIA